MYCHQCGEKILINSQFCSQCGAKVQNKAKHIANLDDTDSSTETQKQNWFIRSLPVIVPAVSFSVVSAGLTLYYFQQINLNEEVLSLKASAEEIALNGDYKQAKTVIEEALTIRPSYSALETDLASISEAIQYEKDLSSISAKTKKSEFEAATKELVRLKEMVNNKDGPLITPFDKQIEEKEIQITVGSIKQELNDLTTIDQLASKLSILASLPAKEASAVREEILNKIVQISLDEAEKDMTNKQFSEAFSIIDKGLQYAVNHEKLLALKNRVKQEQTVFEQAEQQRIEQAMEAAAKEELKNRTAAVELSGFHAEVDEYGDLYLSGEVENVATAGINSVTIYYSIYDENKERIDSGDTSVYPFNLKSGEIGSFEDTYYGVYQDVTVEIDNITWYLNE